MAKKNEMTFLIRSQVVTDGAGTYADVEIDLGSYTNLGSSKPEVLRIHKLHYFVTDANGQYPSMTGDTGGSLSWQLCTQQQTALVQPTNDSFVAGGVGGYRNADTGTFPPNQSTEATVVPQDYVNGYLVAVPSLFLAGLSTTNWAEAVNISIIMECSTEPMDKNDAVSLAISQQ